LTTDASRWRLAIVYVSLLVLLTLARAADAHRSLWLLADQIRDWRIALGPASALPLVGTPSTAGGDALGPIYYWILWASRVLIGPFVSNLPHAGVYGIACVQGAGDLALLYAVHARTRSLGVALATVLLAATAPHDLAISGTIWNPSVSVAFVKIAIALRLVAWTSRSAWGAAATTAAAWLAVQAHSAAIFVAAPIVASFAADDLVGRRFTSAARRAGASVGVVLLLQIPYAVHAWTTTAETVPTRALAGIGEAMASGSLRLRESAAALTSSISSILFAPSRGWGWAAIVAASAIAAAIRYSRDIPMLSVTGAPLATAIVGFSLWLGAYDEYWYLPLAPVAALAVVHTCTWWKPAITGLLATVVLLACLPARVDLARRLYPMPQYGPLVKGSGRIIRQHVTLGRLETTLPMPPFSDETFPFIAMGGRFSDSAAFDAIIDAAGNVRYRER
jgi:hypothetical protein